MKATRLDGYLTVRSEGGLLPADLLTRVAGLDTALPGIRPTDYHLAPGERLGEAVNRSWNRLVGAWEGFRATLDGLTPDDRTATNITRTRWSLVLFQELGYGHLQALRNAEVDAKAYPISHSWGHVSIHLPGARVGLDERTDGVPGAARMSPHGLVQEYLNRSDDHLWGIVCNGLTLRLLRDNAALTRQAYVEFDIQAIFDAQAYPDFALLWLLCHQSRLEGDLPAACVLEQWVAEAARQGTRALDQLRGGVERAINELGTGFLAHRDNAALRARLRSGDLDRADYYRQLLRLVYRLLFLFVAEARDLLNDPAAPPEATALYRRHYATDRIRALALVQRGSPHGDLWEQLKVVMGALGRPDGEPALALPGLGSFLWSDAAAPDIDTAALANRHLLNAVRALATITDGKVLRGVDYRNLGAEELGSVYESLLELHPQLNVEHGTFELISAAGNERKTTGSYYTPTSLITELLDTALDPVIAEALAADNPASALLDLKVLDPACGSGHFLIAAGHRIAKALASARTGDAEPSPAALRTALRDVVGRCLHGIDVNEMAVELCKVSLWLEAVEPGKPLSFLDHRIVHGNALLGTTPRLLAEGLPDDAFAVLEGDDKAVVASLKKRNKAERGGQQRLDLDAAPGEGAARLLAEQMAKLDALPDDTPSALAAKEQRWRELAASAATARARLAADAWCAAFVAAKVPGSPELTTAVVRRLGDDPARVAADVVSTVEALAAEYRFLHPHLAFPDAIRLPLPGEAAEPATGWVGGFDVVLGNPPWDKVQLTEQEFFASRAPDVAAAAGAKRKALIQKLQADEPLLWQAYLGAVRRSAGESRFLRSSGRFPLTGRGKVNTYAVFAEVMRVATAPRGRCGIIVPTGIATDDTTKRFFADVVGSGSLVSLFDFENNEPIFQGVDRRFKFALLTMSVGGTHLDLFVLKQLPLGEDTRSFERVGGLLGGQDGLRRVALEMFFTSWDMVGCGRELDWQGGPFRWESDRREAIRSEIEASMFHYYGLDRSEVDYVLDTFPITRRKDEAKYGEYRTKRVILERYDAMAKAVASGKPYQTVLDPPPAHPSLAHPASTMPDWVEFYQ